MYRGEILSVELVDDEDDGATTDAEEPVDADLPRDESSISEMELSDDGSKNTRHYFDYEALEESEQKTIPASPDSIRIPGCVDKEVQEQVERIENLEQEFLDEVRKDVDNVDHDEGADETSCEEATTLGDRISQLERRIRRFKKRKLGDQDCKDDDEAKPGLTLVSVVTAPRFDQLPMTSDDGLFAILDEGCNNSVHGYSWHQKAERHLAERGLRMKKIPSGPFHFNGVGGTMESMGCYCIPICIGAEPRLCGVIHSHCIATDIPLLISRPQQSKLNVMKQMSSGKLQVGGFDIQAYRTSTGLIAIDVGTYYMSEPETPWCLYANELVLSNAAIVMRALPPGRHRASLRLSHLGGNNA